MVHVTLLIAGLISTSPVEPSKALSENLKTYQVEKAKTASDSGAQIRLALWCEARGLEPEKLKHLAIAVLRDPSNATARGLLGLIAYQGRWESPEAIAARLKVDEVRNAKLAAYNTQRSKVDKAADPATAKPGTIEARRLAVEHVRLGMWCEQHGLKPEATAHFTQAVVLDPYRDATWKHLGYVSHHGRWLIPAQVAAEEAENTLQRKSDAFWVRQIKTWKAWLGDESKKDQALAELQKVKDPRSVPSIKRVFATDVEADQILAVEILTRIAGSQSTRELAVFAVQSDYNKVRGAACRALRGRDTRAFLELLVGLIHSPMSSKIQPVGGSGLPGFLLVETPRFKMLRGYEAPDIAQPGLNWHGYVGMGSNGLPVVAKGAELRALNNPDNIPTLIARFEARARELIAEASVKAVASHRRMVADITQIECANSETSLVNDRVIQILKETVDAPSLGEDEDAWKKWAFDRQGYRYEPPRQITLALNALPQYPPSAVTSCFAAGTLVRTVDGRKPIESIRVGDQVLSQDVTTGSLAFQSVNVIHHNAPAPTIHVKLDNGDTIVASTFHRFWRAGRGWAMARDLKTGDVLRTLGGTSKIVTLENGASVPVFNLDVAVSRTYFVGERDALVHDNTLPDPDEKGFDVVTH